MYISREQDLLLFGWVYIFNVSGVDGIFFYFGSLVLDVFQLIEWHLEQSVLPRSVNDKEIDLTNGFKC